MPVFRKNFAPGCPRSDDSRLARPTAFPVLPVGLSRNAALRSPQGGAFRARRRARPITTVALPKLWPKIRLSRSSTPRRAASRHGWFAGGIHFRFLGSATRSPLHGVCGTLGLASAGISCHCSACPRYSMACCRAALRLSTLSPALARSGNAAARVEKIGCRSAPPIPR
jgi:hypothetical protein